MHHDTVEQHRGELWLSDSVPPLFDGKTMPTSRSFFGFAELQDYSTKEKKNLVRHKEDRMSNSHACIHLPAGERERYGGEK